VDSRVTALDAETLEPRDRWDIPGGPDCIAFDPQGRVWMTLRWIARIAVLDPATGSVETIPAGRSPHGIFVHPRQEPLPPLPAAATQAPVATAEPTLAPAAASTDAPTPQPAVWQRVLGR
jgi:hypothetical protein